MQVVASETKINIQKQTATVVLEDRETGPLQSMDAVAMASDHARQAGVMFPALTDRGTIYPVAEDGKPLEITAPKGTPRYRVDIKLRGGR